ncbi:hypothetical protein [Sandaracinus amylolyticus]|uniref:hypothetical protein n=1 Tax=Sandaracinus amylolyticus TaxID=927083 RepID=UPI001F23A4E7|nr:hypothetical protein [Sandaracinus amylolyticus]UJR78937.1 Hypothetical protein I5071_9700 [Sandaracinus amylolyticus]
MRRVAHRRPCTGAHRRGGFRGIGGGSVAPAWSPAQLTNLRGWYRADDLVVSGAEVTQWTDKSGNAYHLTPPAATNRPTFEAAGLGGKPSVRFDGTDDVLRSATNSFLGTPAGYTIALVMQEAGARVANAMIAGYGVLTAAAPRIRQQASVTVQLVNATLGVASAGIATTSPLLAVCGADGASQYVYYGTTLRDSDATTSVLTGAVSQVFALGAMGNATLPSNIRIAEAIVMTAWITPAEHSALAAYVSARYGV